MICSQSLVFAISSSLAIVTASSYGLPAIGQLSHQPVPNHLSSEQIIDAAMPVEPEIDADIEPGAEDSDVENTGEETGAESQEILTESERIRRKLLIQGDAEYAAGNLAAAEALYRQAKDESWLVPQVSRALPPEPFSDERLLSAAGGVYWRESQAGIENGRLSQTVVALKLLTQEVPAFISGHLRYAAVLKAEGQLEAANGVLEQALTLYPGQTDLLLAQVDLYMSQEAWLEAAIASRQFAALNSDHPQAATQSALAAENLERFQTQTRGDIRQDAIANAFTGILSYAFTGSIFGPFTAADSAIMLLQGENQIGHRIASQIQQRLPMLEQPEALGYVRRIGNRLAAATGRHDLDYEFFVILDPTLNAFALPGGKVFINAGAILKTRSEAELAGLIAHEISHSVLSHGFQMVARGNLSSSLAQYLPYGGLINNVFLSGYSRTMERQADIVGTQIVAAGGYAAGWFVQCDDHATRRECRPKSACLACQSSQS